ncbi:proline-rich protein 36-like [Fundulus heteroclitus]|uniref:proline-rich protein 36-like n=1 Tax=Fundulus heteroclitus TaxID=8078 RepID=UPI00165ABAC8|nr:proline-rich protein 36-like [Fundulus heteroclitus]
MPVSIVTKPGFTALDIEVLESIHKALHPLQEFTDALSGEEYVSISYLKPVLHLLSTSVLAEDQEDTDLTRSIKTKALAYHSSCSAEVPALPRFLLPRPSPRFLLPRPSPRFLLRRPLPRFLLRWPSPRFLLRRGSCSAEVPASPAFGEVPAPPAFDVVPASPAGERPIPTVPLPPASEDLVPYTAPEARKVQAQEALLTFTALESRGSSFVAGRLRLCCSAIRVAHRRFLLVVSHHRWIHLASTRQPSSLPAHPSSLPAHSSRRPNSLLLVISRRPSLLWIISHCPGPPDSALKTSLTSALKLPSTLKLPNTCTSPEILCVLKSPDLFCALQLLSKNSSAPKPLLELSSALKPPLELSGAPKPPLELSGAPKPPLELSSAPKSPLELPSAPQLPLELSRGRPPPGRPPEPFCGCQPSGRPP